MVSDELVYDKNFNSLTIEAQNIFVRMLAKSDDFGVIPAGTYELDKLINTPPRLRRKLGALVREIVAAGVGIVFEHDGKWWFAFKRESFDRIQSYVIKNRTKSDYLRLSDVAAQRLLSGKFREFPAKVKMTVSKLGNINENGSPEIPGSSGNFPEVPGLYPIERQNRKIVVNKSRSLKTKESKPESQAEVREFFKAHGVELDHAEAFWLHFSSNGWKVGGKAPMKNWHAAALNWIRRIPEFSHHPGESAERRREREKEEFLKRTGQP